MKVVLGVVQVVIGREREAWRSVRLEREGGLGGE